MLSVIYFYINTINNDIVFIILFDHLHITVMADWAFKVSYLYVTVFEHLMED